MAKLDMCPLDYVIPVELGLCPFELQSELKSVPATKKNAPQRARLKQDGPEWSR
jgi:hypothetical protein